MVELKYIGTHQPQGMIIDVKEEDVERLIDSGEYEPLEAKKKIIIPKEETYDNRKRFSNAV